MNVSSPALIHQSEVSQPAKTTVPCTFGTLIVPEAAASQGDDAEDEFQLTPPTVDQLFRAESEATSRDRIRKAGLAKKVKIVDFPRDVPLPPAPVKEPTPQLGPLYAMSVHATICYRPLYFEDRLTERQGYFIPLMQPAISSGKFYLDTLLLPFRMVRTPPWTWQCSLVLTRP